MASLDRELMGVHGGELREGPIPNRWSDVLGQVIRLQELADFRGVDIAFLQEQSERGDLLVLSTHAVEVVPINHLDSGGNEFEGLAGVIRVLDTGHFSRWTTAAILVEPMDELEGRTMLEWITDGPGNERPLEIAHTIVESRK